LERLIEAEPIGCRNCGALLLGADLQAQRHLVTSLLRIQPIVTEYRCYTLAFIACRTATQAD